VKSKALRRLQLAAAAALVALSPATGRCAEVFDPEGNLHLPLASAGMRVCVLQPAWLQDATACDGIDLQGTRALLPRAREGVHAVAIAVVRTEADRRGILTVVRSEDENSVALDQQRADTAVSEFVADLPGSLPSPNRVLGGDDHARLVKLGSVSAARGFAHLELAANGKPPRRFDLLVDMIPSHGWQYTVLLMYSPGDQQAFARFEDDVLSRASVDAPPPAYPTGHAFGLVVPVALVFAFAAGFAIQRARRRRAG
jgi:hypothetical protein